MSGFNGNIDAGALHPNDVVDNLTSTATDKPLSAAQGKALNDKYEFASVRYTLANNASVAITATTVFVVSVKNASADQIMGGCVFASLLGDNLRIHTISGNGMIGLSYLNGVITITNTGGMYQTFMIMYK